MELKEEMYVRTKQGIAKIIEIFDKDNEPYDEAKYRTDTFLEIYYDSEYIGDEDIIGEPSYNITDLIEVGDYVNGFRVVWKDNEHICINAYFEEDKIIRNNNEIKSIVTKEQFESMQYRVGE